ncbi:1118_t:CDS:10 [Paraglomus occultum]|uniref:1118_t:CDS:1 n=1 Tax=Paraglomus occultum TaxID=144539 RepID=A0A9N8WUE0_9GLOM|nr:1118_t:CDS:10 [Paraglomus occultum]
MSFASFLHPRMLIPLLIIFQDGDRRGPRDNRRFYDRGDADAPSQHEDETSERKLANIIIAFGNQKSPEEMHGQITELSTIINNEFSLNSELILRTLKACVTELPMKTFLYATLVGVINVERPTVGAAVVEMAAESLQSYLNEGNWRNAKLMLKFFAELTNAYVILPGTMISIYNTLANVICEPGVKRLRADTIAEMILLSIPCIGKRLHERVSNQFDELLDKFAKYFDERRQLDSSVTVVFNATKPYYSENLPYEQSDTLELLWASILNIKDNNWACPMLVTLWPEYDSMLVTADQHEVEPLNIPPHSDRLQYAHRHPVFRIFVGALDETKPLVPDPAHIDYFLMYDVVQDVIDIFEVNRKECVKILKDLRYFFAPGTFASDDKNITVRESQNKVVGDGKAIRILFDRLDMMDVECVYRYWNWFSHHLSNFNFVWKWKEWEDCIREDPLHPKLCFIRETFEKLIRYSYYDRIKSNVSDEFLAVFPAAEPTTSFRYVSDANQYHALAQQVLGKLRSKSSNDQIQSILAEVRTIIPDSSEDEQEDVMRDILVQCVLMLGSKSFSHVLNVIERSVPAMWTVVCYFRVERTEFSTLGIFTNVWMFVETDLKFRYLTLLQSYNTTAEARVHTVKIVADFWSKNTQFLGILLDKLLNYRVVDASSVVTWVFSEEFDEEVSRSYIWEILKNTINKVISRVSQIQSKLDSLRKAAEEQGGDMTSDDRQSAVGSEAESIQQIENTLSMVTREQKEVLLLVFQKFADVLSKKLLEYRQQNIDDPLTQWWFYWVWGFFREIARVYYSQLSSFIVTLETIVLTSSVDPIIENTVKLVRAFGYVAGQLEF